jgi:hypothetical protein
LPKRQQLSPERFKLKCPGKKVRVIRLLFEAQKQRKGQSVERSDRGYWASAARIDMMNLQYRIFTDDETCWLAFGKGNVTASSHAMSHGMEL